MTTILYSLFYLWLVTSILLVALWFLRRHDRLQGDETDPDTMLSEFDGPVLQATPHSPATAIEGSAGRSGQAEASDRNSGRGAVTTESSPEQESRKMRSRKSRRRNKRRNEPKSTTAKIPVQTPDADANSAVKSESGPTDGQPTKISKLLQGINLPFDLTPLSMPEDDAEHHAVFLSPHGDAGEVGTAFADQLVFLGYEIEAAGLDQATARRNKDILSMRISADDVQAEDGDQFRHPAIGQSDVVIEVWIGTGPPPRPSV